MSDKFRYSIPVMTKRLLAIAAPVKKQLVVSTLASIVGNLSQMSIMAFGALLLLSAAGYDTYFSPAFSIAAAAVSAILIVVCRYIEGYVSHAGAYSLLAHMRISFFDVIRRLAPARLVDREKGDIMNIAVSDIETVEFFFAHTIGPIFTVVILPTATLALAFAVNPIFAAVLLPIYITVSIIFPLFAVKAGRKTGYNYRVQLGRLKSQVLESIYGLRDIQIFGCGQEKLKQVQDTNIQVNRAAHGLTLHRQTVSCAPAFLVYLARIAIIAVASYLASKGTVNPVGTVVISFVATASFSSTQSLTMVVSSLLETYAAAERLFALEDTAPEFIPADHPEKIGKIESIVFDNVSFNYGGSPKEILSDFSLSIKKGDKLGIVGESGIGKSTVLRLLMGFWKTTKGKILINGIPIDKVSFDELYSRIAVFQQDTFIFSGTIAQNIALGRPNASPKEIELAARRAGIDKFIARLPQGYSTQMGEMGSRLSGGEKQRIGIARVLLSDPDVIVMDEPTGSLDILHEKALLKTLREEFHDKTIIIVSHRPSTLTDCTSVIRIKDGKICTGELCGKH